MGIWLEAEIETVKDFRFKESPTTFLYSIFNKYVITDEVIIKQRIRNGPIHLAIADSDCYTDTIHTIFKYLIKNKATTGIHSIIINRHYYF